MGLQRRDVPHSSDFWKIEVLEWVVGHVCPLDVLIRTEAIKRGHLEMLKWLIAHGCPEDEESDCNIAASHGQFEILKWLRKEGFPWRHEEDICLIAISSGHWEMLKWLIEQGCTWPVARGTFTLAKSANNVDILNWAKDEGYLADMKVVRNTALKEGNIVVLQWYHQLGLPWNKKACVIAARSRQLKVLKWFRERSINVSWDRSVIEGAMENQSLKLVKWIILNAPGSVKRSPPTPWLSNKWNKWWNFY
mgnify:FL=1